ncbi:MAG TPA: ankyrin repeat domain-containing protein [Pyrinomonadaceae bacterium]|nr:ankyrin repeat domain-containing protein [Pyrinomonadaceae bacterium]
MLLTQAVSSGDAGAVSALLANGANVNERTSGGQTPLILATIFGHTHLIPLLLEAGADPHLRDNLGLNAIDWAQRRGATEATQLFNKKPPLRATNQPERREPLAPPPSRDANERARSVSEGEKSQRWLAGVKQRIAEQSQREVPEGSNIFRAQPQVAQPEPQITQPEPPRAPEPEPQITQIKPTEPAPPRIERTKLPEPSPPQIEPTKPTRAIEQTEPAPPQIQASNPTRAIEELEPAPPLTPKKIPGRKRCPKCGAIYNSDLLAYCAHHVVELVDADEPPIISEPPKTKSPVLLWMIIVITVTGSLVVGSLITAFFTSGNHAAPQTATGRANPPTPRSVQRGTPAIDPALEGKQISLPVAECPLNGQEAIPGTVVVHVVINKNGQVTSARASGGDWLLRGAASEAAMKSTFSPDKLRRRETEGTITYTFEP